MSQGVLLVNLGSPNSPSVADVRRYLREFLMDPRVLDVNWVVRFAVVNFAILPKRPAQSAEAYHKIWTKEGSPLVVTSRRVCQALKGRLDVPIELAMRYQNPSIRDALKQLFLAGVDDLLLIPLFPHFAMSSFETAIVRVQEIAAELAPGARITVQPPYFADPEYLEALVASAGPWLERGFDHLLFSFHGIPERHLRKSDPTGAHCLSTPDCCAKPGAARATCYRAQCLETMAGFVQRAKVPTGKYSFAFQSRLGRDPWLKPYTDMELGPLAKRGVRKLLVICPAFVSDCLETLEEIGIRAREDFLAAGGRDLQLIPCMNEHPSWIKALEGMVEAFRARKTKPATLTT